MITAQRGDQSITNIQYCITKQDVSLSQVKLDALTFTPYIDGKRPKFAKGSSGIVCAKITDGDDVLYIRSDGITINNQVIKDNPNDPKVTTPAATGVSVRIQGHAGNQKKNIYLKKNQKVQLLRGRKTWQRRTCLSGNPP